MEDWGRALGYVRWGRPMVVGDCSGMSRERRRFGWWWSEEIERRRTSFEWYWVVVG